MKTVDTATMGDVDDIMGFLAQKFFIPSKESLAPVNAQKTMRTISNVIEHGVAFIVREQAHVVGSLGLVIQEPWWSSEKNLSDVWYYADHDAPGSSALLLKSAIELSKIQDKPLIMSVGTGTDIESKHKFFTRMGFRNLGGMYEMRSH